MQLGTEKRLYLFLWIKLLILSIVNVVMKLLLLLLAINIHSNLSGKIIYVIPDSSEFETGQSWEFAFSSIRSALEVAEYGDTIFLKEGTYGKFLDSSYFMKSGVKIFGGFKGTETSLIDRGEEFNHSKIIGHNQAFICINTDSTTLMDGIYFEKNYASIIIGENDCNNFEGDYRCTGGAIFIGSWEEDQPACLRINNCIFYDNAANFNGGAVYLYTYYGKGGLWVTNSTFRKNRSYDLLTGFYERGLGGALAVYHGEKAQYGYIFENCTFEENEANHFGAIQFARPLQNNIVEFIDCIFYKNKAKYNGGAIIINGAKFSKCQFKNNSAGSHLLFPGSGGALIGNKFLIENCIFDTNKAAYGGAIYGNRMTVANSQLLNNYCLREGGAIFQATRPDTDSSLMDQRYVHCTFAGNHSDSEAGTVYSRFYSRDSFLNCVFTDNTAVKISNNIYYAFNNITQVYLDYNYFDAQDTSVAISYPSGDQGSLVIGSNNILGGIDPKLGITQDGLLRPGACSPLVQMASIDYTISHGLHKDLAGRDRPTGSGGSPGALEPTEWSPLWITRNESCPGSDDGSVWHSSDDALIPITFHADDVTGIDTLFLPNGMYHVVATDNAGCQKTQSIQIEGYSKNIIQDTLMNPSMGEANGFIQILDIQGDNPPFSYKWSTGDETCCIYNQTTGEYFLTITDNIGCETILAYELSFTNSVANAIDEHCSIFPNPSSGKLYLSGISNHDYLIMDATGRIVQQGKQQPALDITAMPAGMYIIRLFHADNSFRSFKIFKT